MGRNLEELETIMTEVGEHEVSEWVLKDRHG